MLFLEASGESGRREEGTMGTPGRARTRWAPLIGSVAVSVLGCALVIALPFFLGVTWSAIGTSLASVPALVLLGLLVLWFAGLLVHAPVLMAAMPGLSVRQALTLNLSGSAVSNVLPLGGPAGMGLGFAMARSWGFSSDRFASYTVATNLWNALGKFAMAVGILTVAAWLGVGLPSGLGRIVLSASFFIVLAAGAALLTFRSETATAATGRRLDRAVRLVRPSHVVGTCTTWLLGSRAALVVAVRAGWRRMSLGVAIYLSLQAVLLFACLAAVGAGAEPQVVLIAFAIERLISLAPITPGAAGVAELGTVAALHSFGVDPVSAAAGVLLYRVLIFAIEIPIGGALAIRWLHRSRGTEPFAEPLTTTDPHTTAGVDRAAAPGWDEIGEPVG